jgi:hypothetical protein
VVRLSHVLLSTRALLGILCLDAAARADEPARGGSSLVTESPSSDLESRFRALRAAGDHAYARADWGSASRDYQEALTLQSDATILGRLGMIAARTPLLDRATGLLLGAMEGNGGSTNEEKAAFAAKLAAIRPKVCLVHIVANVLRPEVAIGDRIFHFEGSRRAIFMMPGKHNVRASADGYKDDAEDFEAPAGGEITVKLELTRIEPPPDPCAHEPERIEVLEVPIEPVSFPPLPAVVSGGSFAKNEDAMKTEVALGFAFSPYGMSGVGLGGNGLIGLRWPRVALAMDVRGLITPASGIGEKNIPGRTSIWTGTLLPCVVASVVDICGLGSVSLLNFHVDYAITQSDGLAAGFGGRINARWPFLSRFSALFYIEGAAQLRRFNFRSLQNLETGGPADWTAPSFRITTGIAISALLSP